MISSELVGNRWNQILQKLLANILVIVRVPALGPCWEWTGNLGGGRCRGRPRMNLDNTTVSPVRVSYVHFNGYLPPKKQVDHVCENIICINPAHLEAVTHKENQKRKARREAKPVVMEMRSMLDHIESQHLVLLRPPVKCPAET